MDMNCPSGRCLMAYTLSKKGKKTITPRKRWILNIFVLNPFHPFLKKTKKPTKRAFKPIQGTINERGSNSVRKSLVSALRKANKIQLDTPMKRKREEYDMKV